MADLEAVEQAFLANLTEYLKALDDGIAKAAEFAAANKEAEDAVAAMAVAADDAALAVAKAMGAATGSVGDLRTAFGLAGGAADAAKNQIGRLGLAAEAAGGGFASANDAISSMSYRLTRLNAKTTDTVAHLILLDGELDKKVAAFTGTAAGAAALAAMMGVLNARTTAVAGTAVAANTGIRLWGTGIRLTTTAVHAMVSGVIEFLAVAIPATVAAGAWAAVWMQGAQNVGQHMESLYTATEATANMFHVTAGMALGLKPALQAAQDAANPQVYQALGSALIIVQEHFGNLAQAGLQVGHVFDEFAAKLAGEFAPGGSLGSATSAVLSKMVTDLVQLGQVLGNLGHAILEFGAKMPGAANLLLDFLVVVTHLITALSDLPRPIIFVVFALHELNTWGSVAVAMLTRLGLANVELQGSFFGLARAAGIIRAVMTIIPAVIGAIGIAIGTLTPALAGAGGAILAFAGEVQIAIEALTPFQLLLIAVAAVGVGILIDKMLTMKTATQEFTASLQAAADKASNLQVLGVLADNTIKLGNALGNVARVSAQAGTASLKYGAGLHAAQSDTTALTGSIASMGQQFITVTAHAKSLATTYGTSFVGALALADAAGIKLNQTLTSKSWAAAQLMVQSLVRGYKAMGQPVGAVGTDMTALAIQSGLATTQVDKLNQAWDQFMANLTGGTSGLAAFNQSLTNLASGTNQVTNVLGKTASVTLSVQNFAKSLQSFSGKGAQAWQNLGQVVGSTAPQLIDWMRTAGAEGALSGQQFQKGILDMLSELTPLASRSKDAQAQLIGLAQQAGLNIHTFPDLKAAIADTGASTKDLSKIISDATIKMGNMSDVARQLGTVMNTIVTQSMATAALKAAGFSQAISALDAAIKKYGADSPQAANAAAGVGAAQAKANGIVAAGTRLLNNYQLTIDSLHGKTVFIDTVTSGGVIQAPGGGRHVYAGGTSSARPGMALVGEEGPELMMMRGGEHVIPAAPTKHLLQMASMVSKVHGYAAGTQSSAQLTGQLTRELAVLAQRILAASSVSGISQYINNLLSSVKQLASIGDISGGEESRVVHLIRTDNRQLDHLFRERARILARIKAADAYAANVTSTAAGTASLSTIVSAGGGGPVSSSFLLASMKIDLSQIRKFGADIKRLEHLGLDRALLNQIIQMGPAAGDQVALALIDGPLSNIRALNATETQVQKSSRQLGRNAANMMYDTGRDAGRGFLSGLKGEQKAIERLMEKIARDMVGTLRRELGIHSDSTVTREIGQHLIGGLITGARDRLPALDSALKSAAGHVPSALGSAAGSGGGGGDVVIHNHIMVPLPSARQQYSEVQTQTLRTDRRNGDNRLSIVRGRGS